MTNIAVKKLVTKTVKITPSVDTDGDSPSSILRYFTDFVYVPVSGSIYDTACVSINGQEILSDSSPEGLSYINSRFYYTLSNDVPTQKVKFTIYANPKLIEYPYTIGLTPQNYGDSSTYAQHYGRLNTDPTVTQPTGVNFASPSDSWFNENDTITLQYQYELTETIVVP